MDWLTLSDKTWESILCNLSERHLLNAIESCKKFNDLFSTSQRLTKLICLKIEDQHFERFIKIRKLADENGILKALRELKLLRECLAKSNRKYDSIIISNLKDYEIFKSIYDVAFDILKQFAGSVSQLTFLNTSLQDNHFFEVIQTMKNLKVLKFEGRGCDTNGNKVISESERPDIVTEIDEISIKDVSFFSFKKLYMFDNITSLDVDDWWKTDFETFEYFLFLQKRLKVLHLRNLYHGLMFKTDILSSNIKFSLDELTLNAVYWKENEYAMKFFKTQTNLKKVTLYLQNYHGVEFDEKKEYTELLVQLFGNNQHLKTVYLSTNECHGYNIKDFSFLDGIVNPSVEDLTLDLNPSQNGTEYITALTKLFPNVKNFTYTVNNEDEHGLDVIDNWKSMKYCCLYDTELKLFAYKLYKDSD